MHVDQEQVAGGSETNHLELQQRALGEIEHGCRIFFNLAFDFEFLVGFGYSAPVDLGNPKRGCIRNHLRRFAIDQLQIGA